METTTDLIQRLHHSRALTDQLFQFVKPDAFDERPIPERHRIIFYLGHLEAFDWNLIGSESLHPSFDRLFSFGIDPKEGALPDDEASDWPSVEEVRNYNCQVRRQVDALIERAPEQMLHVAIEHRLMHAETVAYMLHNLPFERKIPPRLEAVRPGPAPPLEMIEIPAGTATLGRKREDGFGWDNEFEEHTVDVPAFAIGKRKVTNGDYLKFVTEGATPPHFWMRRGPEWFYRGMFIAIPLSPDWPVYVTQHEAASYARWRGKSLPTEAQFHRAAYGSPEGPESSYPWGEQPPAPSRGNFNFERWDPISVLASGRGNSAFDVAQLAGNGWEWTSTVFGPFPGFQPFPFYPRYSSNFFDGDHYVMKGAAQRTAACFLRRSFRNWFRPNYPYMYGTFRLADI